MDPFSKLARWWKGRRKLAHVRYYLYRRVMQGFPVKVDIAYYCAYLFICSFLREHF